MRLGRGGRVRISLSGLSRLSLIVLVGGLLASGCGRSESTTATTSAVGPVGLPTATPPAKGTVPRVVWALYREVNGLDPVTSFDYPENTVISTMCESLSRQQPDGSITPGLATVTYATPVKLTVTLRPSVHFWDGTPVTAQDVVFSLERNLNPHIAGFYGNVFDRVRSIEASGTKTAVINLSQPDYWLAGELSAMPGVVLEKRFVEAQGSKFGTPAGGTMCTGPYQLKQWTSGSGLKVVAYPGYWDSASLRPLAHEIEFKGVSESGALISGFETGEISGTYLTDTSSLAGLRRLSNVKVFNGPSFDTDYFIVANLNGPLGDVRVRQALSLAFDRQSYINAVYDGSAQIAKLSVNPGAWGFARNVFESAWDSAPLPHVDLAKARSLIAEAHAQGKPLVIATSTGIASTSVESDAWQAAANSIGLKARLVNFSPQNYINLFTEAGARRGIDAFTTTTYGDYADPAALDATYVLPGGSQDFDNYSNPQIAAQLNTARAQADPTRRAQDDVAAEKLIMQQLPWIPIAAPDVFLAMNTQITGAPSSFAYMQAPWLALVGAAH